MSHRALPLAVVVAALASAAPPAAAAPYAADTVIAKFRPGVVHAQALARRAGVRGTVATLRGVGAKVLRVSGDPTAVAARLARTRGVRWAEPNYVLHAAAAPDDPRYGELYGLSAIGAPAGWEASGFGAFPAVGGAPVAIVDTGIDAGHEDLQGKVAACAAASEGTVTEGACADANGHGTHVAGTIGALANNGLGVTGVAFASPLIVCRALDAEGSGTTADIAACIRWAHAKGAKVISMSLGGPQQSRTLAAAAKLAWDGGGRKGSLLVAAAGNDGTDAIEYPAGLSEVVSVAAVGRGDTPAAFSNRNPDVEVAAPGVDILSAKLGGGYVAYSGTSMATPHVAGAAALLWALHPRSAAATIRKDLDAAVADLGAPGRDDVFGFGRVDLTRAR